VFTVMLETSLCRWTVYIFYSSAFQKFSAYTKMKIWLFWVLHYYDDNNHTMTFVHARQSLSSNSYELVRYLLTFYRLYFIPHFLHSPWYLKGGVYDNWNIFHQESTLCSKPVVHLYIIIPIRRTPWPEIGRLISSTTIPTPFTLPEKVQLH